eukprot:COSAG03_NODE_1803_length_3489_cov_5.717109_1_plen_60_part_00
MRTPSIVKDHFIRPSAVVSWCKLSVEACSHLPRYRKPYLSAQKSLHLQLCALLYCRGLS